MSEIKTALQLLINARILDAYIYGNHIRFTLHGIPFCMTPEAIIATWRS